MEPPAHHARRPGARDVVQRLGTLISTLGSRSALYEVVGGVADFERLVATRKQLETYFGSQQSLPKDETVQRIRCFLSYVEPAVAAGTRISPRALRSVLEADITSRAARNAATVRRSR